MLNTQHIKQLALFLSAFFVLISISYAQKNILELAPGAEKLIYIKETGENRLIGNIKINYQSNTIFCDSASYFDKSNIIKAYGNVHFSKRDTLNLYCDSLWYSSETRIAKLWGNVKIRDKEYKISTDSLEFDSKKEVAVYRNGGKIEGSIQKDLLTSKNGYFYPNSKNITVSGNVKYKSPTTTLITDSLSYLYNKKKIVFHRPTKISQPETKIYCSRGWYNTKTEEGLLLNKARIQNKNSLLLGDSLYTNPIKGISIGSGNISYSDTTNGIIIHGNNFYKSNKDSLAYITNKSYITYTLKEDTLHVYSDTIFAKYGKENNLTEIKGKHNSKIFSENTQGICDSILYTKTEGKLELYSKPILWCKNSEIKGDIIQLFLKDSILDYAIINSNATAVLEVDSLKYYNQVGGKLMKVFFNSLNEIRKIEVQGNAQTVYFPEETIQKDTLTEIKRKGMSRLYASSIKIFVENNEFTNVSYIDQADGVFYPINQINTEEQFITGFSWNPKSRPKKLSEIFPNKPIEKKTSIPKTNLKKVKKKNNSTKR